MYCLNLLGESECEGLIAALNRHYFIINACRVVHYPLLYMYIMNIEIYYLVFLFTERDINIY